MEKQARGSDAVIEAYRAGGFKLEHEAVEAIANEIGGRDVHDILVRGIPHPDFLRATFAGGDATATGELVSQLLGKLGVGSRIPGSIRVFPMGIPWPEEFLVDLTVAEHVADKRF